MYEARNQKEKEGDGISKSYSKHRYETRFQKAGGIRKTRISPKKLKCVSFPPEAKAVLHDLFTRYPPCDGDTTGTSLGIYTTGNVNSNWKDDFFKKPHMTKHDIENNVVSLSSRLKKERHFREVSSYMYFQKIVIFSLQNPVSESWNHALLSKRNILLFE
jgi:hypothetical protein